MLDLKALSTVSNVKSFRKYEIIITQNDRGIEEMFILLSGEVEVYKDYTLEERVLLYKVGPGGCFGEQCLFSNEPRTITVIATTAVQAIAVNKSSFLTLCENNPIVITQLFETICNRLEYFNNNIVTLTNQRNNIIKDYSIDLNEYYRGQLYPSLHKTVNIKQPAEYASFLGEYNFKCPHCGKKFTFKGTLSLRVKYTGELYPDMRRKAIDFEPEWFEVATCPHCYYSAFYDYLVDEKEFYAPDFEKRLAILKMYLPLNMNEPKSLEQVYTSYYLAIICADGYKNSEQVKGSLWLRLSWLYNDHGDEVMGEYATKKAYEHYLHFYGNNKLTGEQQQTYCLLLGTLLARLGEYDNALDYLSKARFNKDGRPIYKHLIENEIDKVKEQRKA